MVVLHKAAAEGISQRYPIPRLPRYLTRLHLKVSLSQLLLKVYSIFAPRSKSAVPCISQGSTFAGLDHALCHLDDLVVVLDHGSGLVEHLVHALLGDARLVGHLVKRGHVLQVGDGEVGSGHALLDAPKDMVVGSLRELLQDLQGLVVQLGQRALGVLENVLHLLGHDTFFGQLALLISFAYGIGFLPHGMYGSLWFLPLAPPSW